MTVRVRDVMTESVVTATPHDSVGRVRGLMEEHRIGALPIINGEGNPIGILTASDLLADPDPDSPVGEVMTDKILTVTAYDDVSLAARVMRNHRTHHVVVTHEKRVAGVLSAYDLLELVEQHRWVPKNPPPRTTPRRGRRRH